MTYGFVLRSEARAFGRIRAADPAGARLVAAAIRMLTEQPRPEGVRVLSEAEGLHLLRLSRSDPTTGATIQYRVIYLVDGDDALVTVIFIGTLPSRTRRR